MNSLFLLVCSLYKVRGGGRMERSRDRGTGRLIETDRLTGKTGQIEGPTEGWTKIDTNKWTERLTDGRMKKGREGDRGRA